MPKNGVSGRAGGEKTYVLEYLIIVQYDLLLFYFMDRFVTTYIYNISSIVR